MRTPGRRRFVHTLLGSAGAAAALLVAFAAVSPASDPVPISLKVVATVSPNKAGTPAHPQGVKIDAKVNITMPQDQDPPLTQSVDMWFPKGGVYNGGKYPSCSENVLARSGPSACPKGSIMGKGSGLARADTVWSHPDITIVNGGATKAYAYTVLDNPARVQAPVPATITKLPPGGKWSYKVHAVIPKTLQIVAGIPLALQYLHLQFGRANWITTTSCPPSKRWPYHVEINYDTGQVLKYDNAVACR